MTKIIDLNNLHEYIVENRQNKIIILATGVFDLLHSAHIKFLKLAKQQGDILLVGLESDERVRKLKGESRPAQNLDIRLENISKLDFVNYAFALPKEFDSQSDYDSFIALIKPDILAVSSHTPNLTIKKKLIRKYGGQLKIVMIKDSLISTTKILKK